MGVKLDNLGSIPRSRNESLAQLVGISIWFCWDFLKCLMNALQNILPGGRKEKHLSPGFHPCGILKYGHKFVDMLLIKQWGLFSPLEAERALTGSINGACHVTSEARVWKTMGLQPWSLGTLTLGALSHHLRGVTSLRLPCCEEAQTTCRCSGWQSQMSIVFKSSQPKCQTREWGNL